MKVVKKPTVLLERFPYRYIQVGILEINGMPDYRIQKVDSYTGRYRDMYLCDNEMQLMTAMEDHDYTCWLDPDGVPAYRKDCVKGLSHGWTITALVGEGQPLQSRFPVRKIGWWSHRPYFGFLLPKSKWCGWSYTPSPVSCFRSKSKWRAWKTIRRVVKTLLFLYNIDVIN